MKKNKIILISSAHFFTDIYSSFLEPILPLLMVKFGIGVFTASVLSAALAISRDMTQPVFGFLSDKLEKPLFIIAGLLFVGVFIPLLGIAPTYSIALVFVILGGLGFAAFHPQGAAKVSVYSGKYRDKGMSYFIVSGRLGHAVGPGLVVVLISLWGLSGLIPAVIPAVVIAVLMAKKIKPDNSTEINNIPIKNAFINAKRDMFILLFIATLRAFIILAFTMFIPMLIAKRGGSVSYYGTTLFLMHLAGTAGVYFGGGFLSEKIGAKMVLVISFLLSIPFLYFYILLTGIQSVIIICIGDFILCLSIPVAITYAQKLVSSHIGTVTSLMMGFSWGIAGIFLIAAGAFAEKFGIQITLKLIAVFAFFGFIASVFLKGDKENHKKQS
ncbi:MFS transporter [candidate division KSB1 bacterium]